MKSNFSGKKRSKGPVNFDGCFTRKPMFQEIASSEATTFLSLPENYQNVCPEFSNNELHIPWVTTPPFSIFPSAHPSLSLARSLSQCVYLFLFFSPFLSLLLSVSPIVTVPCGKLHCVVWTPPPQEAYWVSLSCSCWLSFWTACKTEINLRTLTNLYRASFRQILCVQGKWMSTFQHFLF